MNENELAGLDVSVLMEVLEAGDVEARIILARQLAGLLADPETPEIERVQVTPIVLKLAVDEKRDVRRVLAEELSTVSRLPPEFLFAIVADAEDISLPFIRTTMALETNHMFAILRVGDDARQAAIARRPDITAEVAAYIIAHGKLGACLALLDSPVVLFHDDDLRTLYGRHGNASEMNERLLALPTLPSDLRITQLRRTASRMRQLLADRAWLPANDALDMVTDAEDSTMLRILVEANENELADVVAYLAVKDLLTPSLIVRAASRGEMRVVEALFCHLTGYSTSRTRTMMYGQKQSAFHSLFKKSGLPKSCWGILLAASEVTAEIQGEGYSVDTESFGRRVLEALMTRYESLSSVDREKQIDILGRHAEGRVKRIAQRLKTDITRAA
jgi:uncharacterized protein (DUF2336 family)